MTHGDLDLRRSGVRSLTPVDPDYPPGLLDLTRPPSQVRVLGRLPPSVGGAVAVVGTRYASDEAIEFAQSLAGDLAARGVVVISGGALGIDAAAHRGALRAGGATIVVLASGLARAYPARHASLFARILDSGGGLMSEAADLAGPRRGLFLRRNALIAALCAAVVVVQAPARSGALSTARWAITLKRKVFSVPGSPWDPRAAGSLMLLLAGGEICTSALDVLSVRAADPGKGVVGDLGEFKKNLSYSVGLGGVSGSLFSFLARGAAHPDQIARELDIPTDRVQELLLTLELGGFVIRRADGRYCQAKRGPQTVKQREGSDGSGEEKGHEDGHNQDSPQKEGH